MDNRPVGVYDSGLGGLTAARALRALLPGEDILYFGDTGRVPYGNRSNDTILKYSRQALTYLRGKEVKAVLIACGTISAAALPTLLMESPLPLTGVVIPAAQKALASTRNGRVGVVATAASIASGVYERALSSAEVFSTACPLLVPLVENGRIHPDDVVARTLVEEYTAPLVTRGIDTLILGCTHYPLLEPVFRQALPDSIVLVDAGREAAGAFAALLREQNLLSACPAGKDAYYVSDSVHGFAHTAALFLGREIAPAVEMVDIDAFAW